MLARRSSFRSRDSSRENRSSRAAKARIFRTMGNCCGDEGAERRFLRRLPPDWLGARRAGDKASRTKEELSSRPFGLNATLVMSRPPIPRQLERDVLVEAGHRCAIPTCRQPTVDVAHIKPWADVKEHTFDNLIALCPTCHRRYDKGEIDRKAMLQYKANLGILTSRYGEIERRVLKWFGDNPKERLLELEGGGYDVFLMYLLQDGLLAEEVEQLLQGVSYLGPGIRRFALTDKGRAFVNRWLAPEPLE